MDFRKNRRAFVFFVILFAVSASSCAISIKKLGDEKVARETAWIGDLDLKNRAVYDANLSLLEQPPIGCIIVTSDEVYLIIPKEWFTSITGPYHDAIVFTGNGWEHLSGGNDSPIKLGGRNGLSQEEILAAQIYLQEDPITVKGVCSHLQLG